MGTFFRRMLIILSCVFITGCSDNDTSNDKSVTMDDVREATRDIIGNNAFLYYKNYDEAVKFYGKIMGLKNVFEFPGFAIIYQTSPTTFITLVNDDGSGRGMHSADEPKTIAIALLTDQIDGWYQYAQSRNLNIKSPPKPLGDSPHNGFLVTDPGGYILEFEHFAPHEENVKFMPLLEASENIFADPYAQSSRPMDLGFKGSIYWLYHKDAKEAADFYHDVMGLEKIVEQPYSDIYTSSRTGYIGLVLDGRGIHNATHEKAVNVGFLTSSAKAWYDHLKNEPTFKLRTKDLFHEADEDGNVLIDIVIGYDPDNYYIEIDQFLDEEANKAIRAAVGQE
ncbi:MAG: VOC family protein [Kordiimonadaceae bacterium]|nr:VOC family protein [Kordiimonadaceae bacterium]